MIRGGNESAVLLLAALCGACEEEGMCGATPVLNRSASVSLCVCSSVARSRFASAGDVWCSVAYQIQSELPMIYGSSADFSEALHIATCF